MQTKKNIYFWKIVFFVGIISIILSQNIYASELVIGVSWKGIYQISENEITDLFIKYGFSQEKSIIHNECIFSKSATKDMYLSLKIDRISSNNANKILFECADVFTGLTCFFEAHDLLTQEDEEILKLAYYVISKIESIEIDNTICKGITVTIGDDKILFEKSWELYLELKKALLNDKSISFKNIDMSQGVIKLQDYFQSSSNIMKQNRLFKGKMCPVDVLCNILYEKNDVFKIKMRNVFKKKNLGEVTLTSKSDIIKLIVAIKKYQK